MQPRSANTGSWRDNSTHRLLKHSVINSRYSTACREQNFVYFVGASNYRSLYWAHACGTFNLEHGGRWKWKYQGTRKRDREKKPEWLKNVNWWDTGVLTWYCMDRVSSCNIYVIQQDTQCFIIEFIRNIWWFDMFWTSMVHLQERLQAVCCKFGMW